MPPLFLILFNMKSNIFLIFLLVITFFSCNSDKKSKEVQSENVSILNAPTMDVNNNDTIIVSELVDLYSQRLANKEYSAAVAMLHYVKDGVVYQIEDSVADIYLKHYEMTPIYGCKVQGITFRSEYNNSATILAQIIEGGDIEKGIGVTRIFLNPVKYDGQWYLTLLDKEAEGVKDIYNSEEN